MEFKINGQLLKAEVEKGMPVLWLLRDVFNLTGTKFGCGVSSCGACTIMVDGQSVRSCVLPVAAIEGKDITTIEGLSQEGQFTQVQRAWIKHQVPQCGYCQSGMIIAVTSLLNDNPNPSDEEIDSITNICRCGTYQRIRGAIKSVAESLNQNDSVTLNSSTETINKTKA